VTSVPQPHAIRRAAYVSSALVGAWLLAAAALVDIEYYDGLSAICNARYFLGESTFYIFDRGPLMAWLLMPAEWIKGRLGLEPLDVRPHHLTMALVHGGYLVAVYRGLVRRFGESWSLLAALTTAITSYMFFSYAPFISHDLAAGALLLWMLIWSDDLASSFERASTDGGHGARRRLWILLVIAGTLAPLIKQTFGVLWIAVILAHAVSAGLRSGHRWGRTRTQTLVWLTTGAGVSALLTWITYGLVLAGWAPDLPLWLRPFRNLQYLSGVYDGTDVVFPLWIYVRNLWAYGLLATLLLVPGLVLSFRGCAMQRRIAVAWIVAVAFMHVMPLREVRYLAFVAPLSAFMIVPVVRRLAQYRVAVGLMGAILIIDVGTASIQAARIGMRFYRHNELRTLVEPLSRTGERAPIFHTTSMLSFVAPGQSPLAADRYHRVFHVGIHHVGVLYGYPAGAVRLVAQPPAMPTSARAPDGSVLLFSNEILAYGPTWRVRPPPGSELLFQGVATLQSVMVRRRSDGAYVNAESERRGQGDLMPVTAIGDRVHALQMQADGSFVLTRPDHRSTPPDVLAVRSFVVQRRTVPPGTPFSND
jgi:hypothetical protein